MNHAAISLLTNCASVYAYNRAHVKTIQHYIAINRLVNAQLDEFSADPARSFEAKSLCKLITIMQTFTQMIRTLMSFSVSFTTSFPAVDYNHDYHNFSKGCKPGGSLADIHLQLAIQICQFQITDHATCFTQTMPSKIAEFRNHLATDSRWIAKTVPDGHQLDDVEDSFIAALMAVSDYQRDMFFTKNQLEVLLAEQQRRRQCDSGDQEGLPRKPPGLQPLAKVGPPEKQPTHSYGLRSRVKKV
jgi:hypothetical protein